MRQLKGLNGTASHRVAACRQQTWILASSVGRQGARFACNAQIHTQPWIALQCKQQHIGNRIAGHQQAPLAQHSQPSYDSASQHGLLQQGGRLYSRKARTAARAHASASDPNSDAATGVTTVDKQQSDSSQHAVTAGSAEDFIQPPSKPLYSPLHYDVLEFVRQVVPTAAERAEKQRIIQCVSAATRQSFLGNPHVRVQPFGSFVNGLSTWNSDVDLVVTGLAKPNRVSGTFSPNDKRLVYRALEKIASNLRKHKKVSIRRMIIIRTARIPIIKLETTTNVVADISLGDSSGPKAANYVAQQISAYPPLAPLVLVLKVYLRSCGLNEVANGGLSSFSLTNMVLAHLMDELRDGHDIFDLGETLYGFLLRYGDEFDVRRDAVSVHLGGCVPRSELQHLDSAATQERLLLEDPLTGRDVATGTYRVVAVQMAFSKAARRLEDLAQSRRGSKVNYLEGLFDVRKALDRQAAANGRPPWDRPGKAVNEEYFVIGHGNRYVDLADESHIEYPLEGDDYGDELEAYMYGEEGRSRGRKRRR